MTRLALAMIIIGLTSCETRAGQGAFGGAAAGAVVGGLAGGGQGALIGAGAGAVGGALIGAALDESEKRSLNEKTRNRYEGGEPLLVDDVIDMHNAGISDDKIIGSLQGNGTYPLTSDDVKKLKKANISQRVINSMRENSIY
jgi:outer membrane lipoprotein SlyB